MSNSKSKTSKTAALTGVQALIAGTQKHFPNGSFTLGNATYTTDTLLQGLQSLQNGYSALAAAHVHVKDAVTALTGIETKYGPLARDYRKFVLAAFGSAPQQLADFGLEPPKARAPLTGEQRAAATAKARATRAARGTTSKKQKLAVKGDVKSVTITPVTEPEPSPHPAAPAGPAASSPAPAGATK
jgi:hypothetical protein